MVDNMGRKIDGWIDGRTDGWMDPGHPDHSAIIGQSPQHLQGVFVNFLFAKKTWQVGRPKELMGKATAVQRKARDSRTKERLFSFLFGFLFECTLSVLCDFDVSFDSTWKLLILQILPMGTCLGGSTSSPVVRGRDMQSGWQSS
jgi:hypothetical protein